MKKIKIFLLFVLLLITQGCATIADGTKQVGDHAGRSLDAVNNPRKYGPLLDQLSKNDFITAWKNNPDWIFANFSHIAYFDVETIKNKLEKFGFSIIFYNDNKGRQAFLATTAEYAILSFRGTEPSDINDLLDDIKILNPQTHKEATVHRGFSDATISLMNGKKGIINDLKKLSNQKIYVTGHSLGAAMAVIAGMHYNFEKIVTFGEPRIGSNIHKALLGKPLHRRFVNGNDMVTNAIPASCSYKHYGTLEILGCNKGQSFFFSEFFFSEFYDHSIINYAERLKPNNLN